MSQSVGCYTGWGFEWDCFAATDEVLKSFFRNHKDVLDECAGPNVVKFVLSDEFTYDELEDSYECNAIYGYSGNYAMNLVANIITKETNIRISAVNQEGENDTIMFEPGYPWELTDEERNLTRESLTEMLKKYQTELGMKGEITTYYVEWWG